MDMKNIIKLLKGICIGIANVIPGFSGATMAVITNIYEEFVSAFANFFNSPIKVIKKSWALFVGVLIGIVIALFTIVKLLEVIPLITILFFVGFIIGSIPNLFKKVEIKPLKISYLVTFLITFLLVIILPILNKNNVGNVEISFSVVLIIALLGIASASAMVIPGVSGSMILMIFGYYAYIMEMIKTFITNVIKLDFSNLFNSFIILAIFAIGIIVGLVLISKIIKTVYNKYPNLFNIGVLGLLLASPFAIIYSSNVSYNLFEVKFYIWIIAIVACFAGAFITYFFGKRNK